MMQLKIPNLAKTIQREIVGQGRFSTGNYSLIKCQRQATTRAHNDKWIGYATVRSVLEYERFGERTSFWRRN